MVVVAVVMSGMVLQDEVVRMMVTVLSHEPDNSISYTSGQTSMAYFQLSLDDYSDGNYADDSKKVCGPVGGASCSKVGTEAFGGRSGGLGVNGNERT